MEVLRESRIVFSSKSCFAMPLLDPLEVITSAGYNGEYVFNDIKVRCRTFHACALPSMRVVYLMRSKMSTTSSHEADNGMRGREIS